MSTTHLPYALRQCIYAVNNATSHAAVSRALCRLRWYLVITTTSSAVLKHLNNVPWKPAIARYVSFPCINNVPWKPAIAMYVSFPCINNVPWKPAIARYASFPCINNVLYKMLARSSTSVAFVLLFIRVAAIS